MATISSLAKQFAADKVITRAEAQQIVDKAQKNGVVSDYEKKQIKDVLKTYGDKFEAGAADLLKALVTTTPPTPPTPTDVTKPMALSEGGASRPVFVSASGSFVTSDTVSEPKTNVDLGDGLYRASALVDDSKVNPFAKLDAGLQGKAIDQTIAALGKTAGLDPAQANQLRSSAATTLLALAEAAKDPAAQKKAVDAYANLAKSEQHKPLRDSLIFNLHNSDLSKTGDAKKISDELMNKLAPLYPPYDKWFTGSNRTVNMEWTVGEGQFFKGFTNNLKENGFKAVGAESEYGVSYYEKTVNKPGVGETTFRIGVRQGGSNMMQPAGDPKVQVFGYDGHSDWGNNISKSVTNAKPAANGGDGQLFFYNMCVGKSGLDAVEAKFPNMQVATTYAASNFYTDSSQQMTRGEGVQALLAMVDDIAARAPWTKIHKDMNAAANIGWGRTWDNYVTPVSTLVRAKVLDNDNDGQADYLDKLYDFNTFRVPEDTRREFTPVVQNQPARTLDGTKVVMAGNMINTVSEFSGILDRVNRDSKVVPDGWFEPKDSDKEIVKFDKVTNREGMVEYHMKVSAKYAHASEPMLRAVAAYEFNRYLNATGQLRMDPSDAKINGLLLAQHSLDIDGDWRDGDLWKSFLTKYNFPANVDYSKIQTIKDAEHHFYAGSDDMVAKIKAALPKEVVDALKGATVGEPQ
ncbi:MAG TPA: hypothetical protein VGK67_41470 [Myxococcales bacterium]